MSISMIGDLSQHFLTSRHNTALKTDLNTLVEELTTGQASDLTAHLGASQTKLAGLDRQLQMLGQFSQSNTETGQLLSTMQSALGNIEQHRATTSSALLTINESSSPSQISNAGLAARSGFEAVVQSLNMRSGDRSMFGGNDLDASPLLPANDMLGALQLAVTGLTEAADIEIAINTWFDASGGGFETDGYQGDTTGFMQRQIDGNQTVEIGFRADDKSIRDILKAFALGAIAGDTSITLSADTRRTLQRQSGEDLLSVAAPLTGAQARLGYAEGQVEEAAVRNSAKESSYGIARNDLASVNPFDTAIRLQAVQLQLETHYTLTARLSRLSLTEYLR